MEDFENLPKLCRFCERDTLIYFSDNSIPSCFDESCFFYKYDNIKERTVEYD
jgi:hypothetical protein